MPDRHLGPLYLSQKTFIRYGETAIFYLDHFKLGKIMKYKDRLIWEFVETPFLLPSNLFNNGIEILLNIKMSI